MAKRVKGTLPQQIGSSSRKSIPESAPAVVRRAHGRPSWRFSEICPDGEWGWGEDESAATKVIEFLGWSKNYESMTWDEIFQGGQAGKSIPKENLPRNARNELRRMRHDDIDNIVELRPAGMPRVWGVRHDVALLLLWWDPAHTFCPTARNRPRTGN